MSQSVIWPPIDDELREARERGWFDGRVLNAGAGWRSIRHLVPGELVNQDAWPGDDRQAIDVVSPLHELPLADASFDTVICIAVLEHVPNPDACVAEMLRVLRPGGRVVASVPFLQPEHKVPGDFQRFTRDGFTLLFERNGFRVEEVRALASVYHTLYWVVWEWLHMKDSFAYKLLRVPLLLPLAAAARRSSFVSDRVASGFRVYAVRP
ncbi:class I SAM-dependent methyltransferase [Ramlibacter sp. PS4R-6]|uniref:class I SAM-dependent methyltransferase n=1 Tax=Ramlibacter sp. PS4R-6 TaxID=3133438 RepID=UPI00309F2E4E